MIFPRPLCAIVLLALATSLPATLAAADRPRASGAPAANALICRDIALGSGGTILGQLVDTGGQPLPNQQVTLFTSDRRRVQTFTSEDGNFRFAGLRGGNYILSAFNVHFACRAWAPDTAPPHAPAEVLLTQSSAVVRGQRQIFPTPVHLRHAAGAIAVFGLGLAIYELADDESPPLLLFGS